MGDNLFVTSGNEIIKIDLVKGKIIKRKIYHYFKSKDLLFDVVVERFFQNYRERFGEMLSGCSTREDFVNTFLPMYENYMKEFGQIRGKVHWTVQAAMHDGTLELLRPLISTKIDSWDKKSCESAVFKRGDFGSIISTPFGKLVLAYVLIREGSTSMIMLRMKLFLLFFFRMDVLLTQRSLKKSIRRMIQDA